MSFDPTELISPWPSRAATQEPGFQRYLPLINPLELKQRYLFGIPLESRITGEVMTSDILQSFITMAISRVEHELRINISPVIHKERHHYNLWDYESYNHMLLHHWPVLQIIAFKGKYPNAIDFLQFPMEWLAVTNETGQLHVTPTNGQITQFFVTAGAAYLPLILGSRTSWPQLWEVTYLAGFELDKIPAMINDLIGLAAALMALENLNAVIFPYNSYSVSLDGAGQSVSTPGVNWLLNRIESYKERYDRLMQVAKATYNKEPVFGAL